MKISNILIISPPDYIHSQAFYDIAFGFSESLKELGHKAEIIIDPLKRSSSGATLVFGAHLVPRFGGVMNDGNYIIYQTEQVPKDAASNEWFTPEYIDILKRFPVWDYSPANVAMLAHHGIDASFVPIGYSPCMSNLERHESATIIGGGTSGKQRMDYAQWSGVFPEVLDVDVLFLGSMNERREAIIDDLKAKGLNVACPIGYGAWRDKLIYRSKVLLNIHYYETGIFEAVRVSHYLANGKAVVSEYGKDIELESPYYGAADFVGYDAIVSRVVELVADNGRRKELEKNAFGVFSEMKLIDTLREDLS